MRFALISHDDRLVPVRGQIVVSVNFAQRPYRSFLSHAHADKKIVDGIYTWLTNVCGYKIWYDSIDFPAGFVAGKLGGAIDECQGAIIVLSSASIKSGWVEQEWNICVEQQANRSDFGILQLQLEECAPPAVLRVRKWIDIKNGFDEDAAIQIIEAFHSRETSPSTIGRRQIYLSHGNRPNETRLMNSTCEFLRQTSCRIVKDSPDQSHWDENRIRSIISGCSGLLAFVPRRTANGALTTSKYIINEIKLAHSIGIPALVFVDRQLAVDGPLKDVLANGRSVELDDEITDEVRAAVSDFAEDLPDAPKPAYCFLGHSFKNEDDDSWPIARRALQVVTGLPCLSGDGLQGDDIQTQIVRRIGAAAYSVFDITDDRLNSCIEAGIALGSEGSFDLVSKAPRRRPPFMFRNRQVYFYETRPELVGLMSRLASPYRRVVL